MEMTGTNDPDRTDEMNEAALDLQENPETADGYDSSAEVAKILRAWRVRHVLHLLRLR